MPTYVRDYVYATDLAEAVRLLHNPEISAWVAAPRMPEEPAAPILLDLQRLDLASVALHGGTLSIGGQATLESIAQHPTVQGLANGILAEAARLSAHRGLRNIATLEGALRSNDGPPEVQLVLAVLGASFRIMSAQGEETSDMLAQPPANSILVEAYVSTTGPRRGALARVARTPLDQAIVAAAAVITADSVNVAVAADAANLNVISWSLNGDPVNDETINSIIAAVMADVVPAGDYRGSVEYRRAMSTVLARRAIVDALRMEVHA